jgi:DNA-binding NarL/FixJ family response regulator
VVLMDIRMPGLDGLAATRQIVADPHLAGVRVVVLTTFDLDEYVYEALRGDALLSPGVTRRLIAEFAARPTSQPAAARRLEVLTDREREVLGLVGEGLGNDDIAARLSAGSWASWPPATAPSWWCWPRRSGWSSPAGCDRPRPPTPAAVAGLPQPG